MRILIADQFSELGGAQLLLAELLPALQAEGWSCALAVPGHGPLRTRAEALGIPTHEITCGPFNSGSKAVSDVLRFGVQFPGLRAQLRRLVAAFRPDVLYVNAPRLVPAACSLGTDAPPLLFHLHNYLKQRPVAALTGHFLRRSGASIIANCNFVLRPLREFLRAASVEVIYNGVHDCALSKPKPRTGRIGIIGRISPDKGQKIFVEAARLVHSTLDASQSKPAFVICGGTQFSDARAQAYLTEVRQLAADLPIEFCGWRDDIREILHGLDVMVVASMPEAEATTRVIPEAFSAGVPVLASDLPGIREILSDGQTGFLFPPGDSQTLAVHLRTLISLPSEELSAITANARRQFEQRFSVETFQRRMIGRLRSVGARALA